MSGRFLLPVISYRKFHLQVFPAENPLYYCFWYLTRIYHLVCLVADFLCYFGDLAESRKTCFQKKLSQLNGVQFLKIFPYIFTEDSQRLIRQPGSRVAWFPCETLIVRAGAVSGCAACFWDPLLLPYCLIRS